MSGTWFWEGKSCLGSWRSFLFLGFGLGVSSGPHQIDLAVSVSLVENDCLGGLQTVKNTETPKKETPVGRAGRISFLRNLGRIYDSFSLYPRRPDSFSSQRIDDKPKTTRRFSGRYLFPPSSTHPTEQKRVSCLFFLLSFPSVLVFSLPQLDDSEGGQPGLTGRWTISAFFFFLRFVRNTWNGLDRSPKQQHSQQPHRLEPQGDDVTYQLLSPLFFSFVKLEAGTRIFRMMTFTGWVGNI
jgi:hypothetical protein